MQPKRTCQDFLYQSWPISRIFVGYRTFIQQKQSSKGVLVKRPSESMQHIYRMLQRIFVAKHFCWSCTSAWVFYCKFVAYFQNTFLLEHLWRAAAESDNRRTKNASKELSGLLIFFQIPFYLFSKWSYLILWDIYLVSLKLFTYPLIFGSLMHNGLMCSSF